MNLPKTAPVDGRSDVIEMADEHDIERLADLAAVSRRRATRQARERVTQRTEVIVVGDFRGSVLMNQFLGARAIAGHRKKQRKGNHHPAAQQVDREQLCDRLGIREQDSAARAMRGNRIGECQLAEVLVDARVGFACKLDVRRPGDLQWREVIRVRAGTQQPEHVLRVVPDLNPDRLHAGSGDIRARACERSLWRREPWR